MFHLFRTFKILNYIKIVSLVQKLCRFCWMGGFWRLVELHRKGSGQVFVCPYILSPIWNVTSGSRADAYLSTMSLAGPGLLCNLHLKLEGLGLDPLRFQDLVHKALWLRYTGHKALCLSNTSQVLPLPVLKNLISDQKKQLYVWQLKVL